MSKFYKIILIVLLAGLVIMGIGTAVAVIEVYSLTYKGEKYDNTDIEYTQTELELPDNLAKVFYTDFNTEFTEDETLPYNKVIIEMAHRADYEVEPNHNIQTDLYLYNCSTGNVSKYPVNKLVLSWSAHSDFEEFDIFKTFLEDIRRGEIYSYDRPLSISFTIRGSKETLERFSLLPDNYELHYYDDRKIADLTENNFDEASQEIISENIEARDGNVFTAPASESADEEAIVKVVPVDPVYPDVQQYSYSYEQ